MNVHAHARSCARAWMCVSVSVCMRMFCMRRKVGIGGQWEEREGVRVQGPTQASSTLFLSQTDSAI